jgi:hypothetical protein
MYVHTETAHQSYKSLPRSVSVLLGKGLTDFHNFVFITNSMHICFTLWHMYYIRCLDMFQAILCSSSGGPNCILQHLVCHSLWAAVQCTGWELKLFSITFNRYSYLTMRDQVPQSQKASKFIFQHRPFSWFWSADENKKGSEVNSDNLSPNQTWPSFFRGRNYIANSRCNYTKLCTTSIIIIWISTWSVWEQSSSYKQAGKEVAISTVAFHLKDLCFTIRANKKGSTRTVKLY